ncbi:MAG: BON domain-containing protein [Terriglobales bacterium]
MNLRCGIKTFLLMASLLGGTWVMAQQSASQNAGSDNTQMNRGDQNSADQQKESRADLQMTQQIRKSIMQDKSLSTYAHNVKIITQNGQVTLKGPVRSDDEKRTLEAKAAEIAAAGNVTDELTVKPAR